LGKQLHVSNEVDTADQDSPCPFKAKTALLPNSRVIGQRFIVVRYLEEAAEHQEYNLGTSCDTVPDDHPEETNRS
jgi:hypothetical protein